MQTVLYFLIWGAAFFLMMRFGCGAHVMGHGHNHPNDGGKPDTSPTATVKADFADTSDSKAVAEVVETPAPAKVPIASVNQKPNSRKVVLNRVKR